MVIFTFIPLAYILFVLWLIKGWNKLPQYPIREKKLHFSIVVAARNEETSILNLLTSLNNQNYSKDMFEVIVVDDHSTDTTLKIISTCHYSFRLKVVRLSETEGKKQALKKGIETAAFSTIVTTDADCVVGINWLNSINDCFISEHISLVFGLVTFQNEKSVFEKLQTIEFASLVGAGAATFANGKATMCNGANFCFTKAAFHRVGGYGETLQIASGDDEFLMHKLVEENPSQVVFNKSQAGIVYTYASATVSQFFNQRRRWASKWKHYTRAAPKQIAPLVFVFNFYYLLLPIAYFCNYLSLTLLVTSLAAKFSLDFIFITTVLRFLKKPISIPHFLFLSVLYVFYVPIFGILGGMRTYSWKDRKVTT